MRRNSITKNLLIAISALVLSTGMGSKVSNSDVPIDPSNGIDKKEAVAIAKKYVLQENYQDRLAFSRPRVQDSELVENAWEVRFPFKWSIRFKSGLWSSNVHIDKRSGEIKSTGASPS